MILNGKIASQYILNEIKENIISNQLKPKLCIIQLGSLKESNLYIKNKIKAANKIGIIAEHIQLSDDIQKNELLQIIEKLNNDNAVHGIIIQLPIRNDLKGIINAISPYKDVDGLTYLQQSNLLCDTPYYKLFPCTAFGVIKLLEFYKLNVENKSCLIIGRSNLVGKPLSLMLLNKHAAISVVHSKITSIECYIKNADFIFLAVGKKNLFDYKILRKEQVIVDIGINIEDEVLTGDLNQKAYDILETYSPVPGGVGPMTIAMLLYNVYLSALNSSKNASI